jgi:hypothetical protein
MPLKAMGTEVEEGIGQAVALTLHLMCFCSTLSIARVML